MAKLWLFFLIAIAVALLVRVASARNPSNASKNDSAQDASEREPEEMVPCATCLLNIPRSEALADGLKFFCSKEHLRRSGAE